MATNIPIQHKRSSTPGNQPSAAQLQIGEIAINFADQTLYTKNASGTVISLGGATGPSFDSDTGNIKHNFDSTAFGRGALNNTFTGVRNVAIGVDSNANLTTGTDNISIGCNALAQNTAGTCNIAIGTGAVGTSNAGSSCTLTSYEVAIGTCAGGAASTSGYHRCSVYVGHEAGRNAGGPTASDVACWNTFVGHCAGRNFEGGTNVVAIGYHAMRDADGALSNVAIGSNALCCVTSNNNVGIGSGALRDTTTAGSNVAIGFAAAQDNVTGFANTAVGTVALGGSTTSCYAVAIGYEAARNADNAGDCNIYIGRSAGRNRQGGECNITIGAEANCGSAFTDNCGNYNIYLGTKTAHRSTGDNNIMIGFRSAVANETGWTQYDMTGDLTTQSNRIVMGNGQHTCAQIQVGWTTVSDERDKINIKDLNLGLNFINDLRPVEYYFRKTRNTDEIRGKKKYGFIAQEIAELEEEDVIVSLDNPDKLVWTSEHLLPVMVKAIKELSLKVETLQTELNQLKNV